MFLSVNKVTRTVVLHKDKCPEYQKAKAKLNGCCGLTSPNHRWYCERCVTKQDIDNFIGGNRHWAILLCDKCF